jgi:acyl-CoA reductase-like NAD-dependent aldehyde dehydrogenase
MRLRKEEIFGPLIPISVVESEEEAIVLANKSEYGLTNSIWTNDIQKGLEYARRLESGTVMINDGILIAACPALPFGGAKKSGIGRTGTEDSSKEYYWYPYSPKKISHIKIVTRFLARFL